MVNQKITNYLLTKQKGIVSAAMNGKEAIELLQKNKYDVVLMDLQMPGMNGFATTRYIRNELKNNIPIIAVTADLFVNETNEYLDSGMNACISKPFETMRLSELILSVLK